MTEQSVDWAIIRRVQKGDQEAFNLLVLKYQLKITKLVSRYVKDSAEAKDVTQEVFIKSYRSLGSFRGESAFYTWLYRIAINTAKNYIVGRERRPMSVECDLERLNDGEGHPILREESNPEHQAIRDDLEKVVKLTIEGLPNDLRQALVLRELEGLRYDEIALKMQCPVGTVRSRIFRARESIDKAIAPLLED